MSMITPLPITAIVFGLVALVAPACVPAASSAVDTQEAASAAKPKDQEAMRDLVPPPPTEAMIEKFLFHAVLNHPRVVPFLHLEISSNLPLKVFPGADFARPGGVADAQVGGQKVHVVANESEARVVLVKREDLPFQAGQAPTVRVHVRIPPEGVSGHVDVALADNVWTATDAVLAER